MLLRAYHVSDLSERNSEFDDDSLWSVEDRSWCSVVVVQQVAYQSLFVRDHRFPPRHLLTWPTDKAQVPLLRYIVDLLYKLLYNTTTGSMKSLPDPCG